MKHQFGKTVLRTGLQTLLLTLIMFFLSNMLTPLKAATWEAQQQQQALSHSGWTMASTVGGTLLTEQEELGATGQSVQMLGQISSVLVMAMLVILSCCGLLCIVMYGHLAPSKEKV